MADDAGERTEAATPRRRQEAREKGQVARSTDLNSALLLLGALLGIRFCGPTITAALFKSMEDNLSSLDPAPISSGDLMTILASQGRLVLYALGPVMIILVAIAVLANLFQVGFLFTTQPLAPQLNKLSPFAGIARIFSVRTTMQLVMNLVKLLIVCAVAYVSTRNRADKIMLALAVDGWQQFGITSILVYEVALNLALVLLLIAVVDYAWQRFRFEKDLRMTKQEVKEEMRRMEGDPIIKQRRRKMQFAAVMQQIRKSVPTADVIVTNPTELAIAIKYDAKAMHAPKVVAKGADHLAAKIRELAAEHGIPIIERKPLAQALYKMVDVGQEVPEQFYKAIAEILAYVYRLSNKSVARPAAA